MQTVLEEEPLQNAQTNLIWSNQHFILMIHIWWTHGTWCEIKAPWTALVSTRFWQDSNKKEVVALVNNEPVFSVCSLQGSTWLASAERWDPCPTPGWRYYDWTETRWPTSNFPLTGSTVCECLKGFSSDPCLLSMIKNRNAVYDWTTSSCDPKY